MLILDAKLVSCVASSQLLLFLGGLILAEIVKSFDFLVGLDAFGLVNWNSDLTVRLDFARTCYDQVILTGHIVLHRLVVESKIVVLTLLWRLRLVEVLL